MILKFWIYILERNTQTNKNKTKQNKKTNFNKKHDSKLVDAKQWQLTCKSGKCKLGKYLASIAYLTLRWHFCQCEYILFSFEMTLMQMRV